MIEETDVVVIGAGHNGMAAAGYLSRAGKAVTVVERLGKVGGMTSAGFMIPEAPEYLVTPCAVELLFVRGTGLIEDLELEKHGLRYVDHDPPYAYLDPSGASVCLFRDPRRTAEDMARLNREDGKAYLEFMKLLDALMDIGLPIMNAEPGRPDLGNLSKIIGNAVRNVKLKSELEALAAATSDQVACEWFQHPANIALLTNTAAGAGPIDDDGNAAAYMILAAIHRLGTGKPIGSLQSFADALCRSIEASGAKVLLNAPVAEILIDNGAACGVRLADGRIIKAKAVIASCDPRTAFAMATPGAVDRRLLERIRHVPSNRSNAAPFLANVAMAAPLTLKRHQDMRHDGADLSKAVGYIGTPEEVRESFAAAKRGDIPRRHALSLSPLSNTDPTQAPPRLLACLPLSSCNCGRCARGLESGAQGPGDGRSGGASFRVLRRVRCRGRPLRRNTARARDKAQCHQRLRHSCRFWCPAFRQEPACRRFWRSQAAGSWSVHRWCRGASGWRDHRHGRPDCRSSGFAFALTAPCRKEGLRARGLADLLCRENLKRHVPCRLRQGPPVSAWMPMARPAARPAHAGGSLR